MKNLISRQRSSAIDFVTARRGNIVVLAAAMLVMIFGFAAFSVDVGYLTLTKTQLQSANDAAALAACMELPEGLGKKLPNGEILGATKTPGEVEAAGREAAVDIAGRHRAGDQESIFVEASRDVRFGRFEEDPDTGVWYAAWGVAPYNIVEVTVRRDQEPNTADGPLPLFFAPVIGHKNANLTTRATAALVPGYGFRITGGDQTANVLPFAFDEDTWEALLAGAITDDSFAYDPETGAVKPGSDGVYEVNLFPDGDKKLPPGNRGTVNIGTFNNSTQTVRRQILYGLNADDLEFHGGTLIATPENPLYLDGNTGISAGMKDALETIKGRPSAIPLFTEVEGPGNNATYKIVRFVGVRVVDVKLTGNPKHVLIQPAVFSAPTVIRPPEGTELYDDPIYTTPKVIPSE